MTDMSLGRLNIIYRLKEAQYQLGEALHEAESYGKDHPIYRTVLYQKIAVENSTKEIEHGLGGK